MINFILMTMIMTVLTLERIVKRHFCTSTLTREWNGVLQTMKCVSAWHPDNVT